MPRKLPTHQDTDELSIEQLAEYMGIGVRAVNGLVERKRFPNARKVNPKKQKSAWLIPFSDVKAYQEKKNARAKAKEAKARA